MKRQRIVQTKNREIYEKFSLLNFSPEVLLRNVSNKQINRLLRNINKGNDMLEATNLGEYIMVRKKRPIDFRVYLK